ncbi:hypothetical protein [Naumannella halotolerans]|uniref:ATP-binding protein n=1 Tax=Naumannella halotolerans TaxID=993414 RepID=A0A4R7J1E3_9ACTN|nr:hypothetical protein [Naumannella halotolerans]TDT30884.1 hypothetical protein CLV29_2291 [Naumannella halotolerans]
MSEDEKKKSPSAAHVLVELALKKYRFGCTPDGQPYACPRGRGAHIVRQLRGGRQSLRAELAKMYRQDQHAIPPQQSLADAVLVLEGEAQDATPVATHLRVAEADGSTWIDLGDAIGTTVRLNANGWQLTSDVPVLFARTALTGTLPSPAVGGDLAELWELINVAEPDRPLVLAWLVSAILRADIPHPIAALFGEQGTGKSTASRLLTQLVDPSPVPLRKPPRDADSWVTAAAGSWLVALDNLSTVPDWLSDSLCRAATGDGDVRRQLYTDGQLAVFAFRRVMLLNGIDVGALRGDLAERLIMINLTRIAEADRMTEHDLDTRWQEAYPRLFGALLDLAAGVAGKIPSVRLASKPRMADFALILAAVDQLLGTTGAERYLSQSRTLAEDSLESDPFLAAVKTYGESFTGTAADLLDAVTPTEDGWRPSRDWPKNARTVTSLLRRNAPALRKAGWIVDDLGNQNKAGTTEWHLDPPDGDRPEKAGNRSLPSPPNPPNRPSGGEAGMAGQEYGQSQDDQTGRCQCGEPADKSRGAGLMCPPCYDRISELRRAAREAS